MKAHPPAMIAAIVPTIAVVDDDEAVRAALANLLDSLGLGVVAFASAEAFLASTAPSSVACLIADMQMPGISGLELHRHLVTIGRAVPVILVTAFPREHVRLQAQEQGAIGYFAKPFEARALIECLEKALHTKVSGA